MTISAAFAYFEENEKGSLCAGKKSEFIIVSDNPLEVETKLLPNIEVLACIKNEQVVYSSKNNSIILK